MAVRSLRRRSGRLQGLSPLSISLISGDRGKIPRWRGMMLFQEVAPREREGAAHGVPQCVGPAPPTPAGSLGSGSPSGAGGVAKLSRDTIRSRASR